MLLLSIENVLYTETDFARFNPEGFRRIHNAVNMARQSRDLAQYSDTLQEDALRDANNLLRAAHDRKILEQQLAQKNFESERQKGFDALAALISRFRKARLPHSRRPEIENRIDHLITRFNMKDFNAVCREAPAVKRMIDEVTVPPMPKPVNLSSQSRQMEQESITAMFERGQRLERAGSLRQAVEAYRKVLERNPHHVPAKKALKQFTERQRWNGFNRQRSF